MGDGETGGGEALGDHISGHKQEKQELVRGQDCRGVLNWGCRTSTKVGMEGMWRVDSIGAWGQSYGRRDCVIPDIRYWATLLPVVRLPGRVFSGWHEERRDSKTRHLRRKHRHLKKRQQDDRRRMPMLTGKPSCTPGCVLAPLPAAVARQETHIKQPPALGAKSQTKRRMQAG